MAKATNKEVIQNNVAESNVTTIVAVTPKTHLANAVFAKGYASEVVPARKDLIAAAMKEAGISKDCAATYLQNYKRKNGLQKTTVKSEPATA